MDWVAVAGILDGLYLTLERDEGLANILYFKLLINSAISLVMNENSGENTAASGSNSNSLSLGKTDYNFQIPAAFAKVLIKLVGKYVSSLKDQSNLEQFYTSVIGGGATAAAGPSQAGAISISTPSGLSYMINFLLPLLFYSASDKKDAPKLNSTDISFVITILLNALKPPSKLATTLLLQAPKQHHLLNVFDANSTSMLNNSYNKTSKQLKDIITQSTFLGLFCMQFIMIHLFRRKNWDLVMLVLNVRTINEQILGN